MSLQLACIGALLRKCSVDVLTIRHHTSSQDHLLRSRIIWIYTLFSAYDKYTCQSIIALCSDLTMHLSAALAKVRLFSQVAIYT